jgi:hypothetical protein
MSEAAPNLYIAVLVYSTVIDGGYQPPRFSEDIVPIVAASEDQARAAAEQAGNSEQTTYLNEYGETVRWTFLGLADLRLSLTGGLEPGMSVYSRSFDSLEQYRDLYSIASLTPEP